MNIPSREVSDFIRAALECSVYVAPLDPGLSYEELMEIGTRAGFQLGEMGDALPRVATQNFGVKRLQPDPSGTFWDIYMFREEPEYRNFAAFDFVYAEFNRLIKAEGGARAKLERAVIVERAVARDIKSLDVNVAITILVITGQLVEKDKLLSRPHGGIYEPLPTEQARKAIGGPMHRPHRERAFPFVKDVIERRTDGRPKHAEPLDAFAEALSDLGYAPFRLWWTQTVSELRRSDAVSYALSICVLSAALVEGVLTFVVRHARAQGLGVLGSKTFEGDAKTWKIDHLISSAAMGNDSAILTAATKARAERLVRIRQRIHAGRMLSEYPGGPPDLRPDEAREARETAEIIVRSVLDWLNRYPGSALMKASP